MGKKRTEDPVGCEGSVANEWPGTKVIEYEGHAVPRLSI